MIDEWRDQQCKILEAAAKACELRKDDSPYNGGGEGNTGFDLLGNLVLDWDDAEVWNPSPTPPTVPRCARVLASAFCTNTIHTSSFPALRTTVMIRKSSTTKTTTTPA